MNKKGMMKTTTLFVIVLMITVGIAAQNGVIPDLTKVLDWNKYSERFQPNEENHPIVNIAYKFVDAMGYVYFEVGKFAVDFAKDHPEINWKLLGNLLVLSLLAPIVLAFVKLIIIIFILIKEFIQGRKEKKIFKTKLK